MLFGKKKIKAIGILTVFFINSILSPGWKQLLNRTLGTFLHSDNVFYVHNILYRDWIFIDIEIFIILWSTLASLH